MITDQASDPNHCGVYIDDGRLVSDKSARFIDGDSATIAVMSTNANMTCGDTKDNNRACVLKHQLHLYMNRCDGPGITKYYKFND